MINLNDIDWTNMPKLNKSKDIKELKKFDVDLGFGQQWEEMYLDTAEKSRNDPMYMEIKTERGLTKNPKSWQNTGNFAVEFEGRGKPSGIATTESVIWRQQFVSNGKFVGAIDIATEVLKAYVENTPNLRVVSGGDDKAFRMYLVPAPPVFLEIAKWI